MTSSSIAEVSELSNLQSLLSPYARFRFRWIERFETGNNRSTPQLLAQVGIAPRWRDHFKFGLEISTGSSSLTGSPEAIELSSTIPKFIFFRQAYFSAETEPPLHAKVIAGKYLIPIQVSALVWDPRIPPEGFSEIIESHLGINDFDFYLSAHQWSLDQAQASAVNGTPQRRSWLFVENLTVERKWNEQNRTRLTLNHFYFYDLSEELARISSTLGNTMIGTTRFRYKYAPLEVIAELSGQPLGIVSGISSAFAVNFRTPDQQRGFWIEGHLGNAWLARNFYAALSYIYSEPDVSLSAFTDRDYGSSNRQGILARLNYYLLDHWRVGAAFLWADTLASSSNQNTRKELKLETELKF